MSREESHAILQSALAYTEYLGSPVPLHCDHAVIDAQSGGTLFGDFRFKRFFVDGRVAIFPSMVLPQRSANSVIFATIVEITPNEMRVSYDSSTTRTPVPLVDVVCPCMDVELVPSTSGTSQKDDVFEVAFSWEELEGACTLPALWPPTWPDTGEILSPYGPVIDNLPVFPFDPNWAEGVEVELLRDIASDAAGRSTIQEAKGDAYHRFGFKLTGHNRERSWAILRWFDSMQGRAGTFYFLHPQRPWTLLSLPTLDKVRIKPCGDANHVQKYHRRVALIRDDGTMVVRGVSSVADISTSFEITLSTALPDTNFVAAVPIFIAEFEDDVVTETWVSDGVCTIEFSVVETPSFASVNGPSGISYQQQNPSFLTIPGCNLLLRAGSGGTPDGVIPSFAWPSGSEVIRFWDDTSPGPDRTLAPQPLEKRFETVAVGGFSLPTLILFPQQFQNNRQPSILSPRFSFETQVTSELPPNQRHLWGPNGWTLFLVFTPRALTSPASLRTLFHIEGSDGAFIEFHADRNGVANRAAVRRALPGGASNSVPITIDISTLPYTVYMTFRWDRDGVPDHFRVWVNGAKALSAMVSLSLPTITTYTQSKWFEGFSIPDAVSAATIAQAFGKFGCANMVLSYNRPLSLSELNQTHKLIADIYRTTQEPSSMY